MTAYLNTPSCETTMFFLAEADNTSTLRHSAQRSVLVVLWHLFCIYYTLFLLQSHYYINTMHRFSCHLHFTFARHFPLAHCSVFFLCRPLRRFLFLTYPFFLGGTTVSVLWDTKLKV